MLSIHCHFCIDGIHIFMITVMAMYMDLSLKYLQYYADGSSRVLDVIKANDSVLVQSSTEV